MIRHRSNEKPKIDSKYLKNLGVARWWKLITHRSNEKSKNNNSSNY